MPSGVFKPYAGVSTTVIIFRKVGVERDGTDYVWFYDMQADGLSLDDKRQPVAENDIPDLLEKWHKRDPKENTDRTGKAFFVSKQEIEENGYDLSINRYKETEHEEVEYESPKVILGKLRAMEAEIISDLEAIALTEELLRSTFLDMFGDPVTNPKGWEKVKIKEIVKIHYGKALKIQDRIESGNVPVFGANGQIGFHDVSFIDTPTLIIGRKGSVGEVTYTDCGGWVIDTAFYVEIEKPEKINIRYFYYALKYSNLQDLSITTSIPGLNRDSLYNQQILLPPLEEQKRIAAILDKADAIRQKRKEAIALSDNLFNSLLQKAFSGVL